MIKEHVNTDDHDKEVAIYKEWTTIYPKWQRLKDNKGENPVKDDTMPNECIDVVEVPQPDGKPIIIPQYAPVSHPWDKLFNEVTKALTRGGEQEDTFPKLAPKWNCSEEECALRMAEMKIARIESGKEKEDSYVDAIGYLVLAWQKYCKEQSK